MLQSLFAVGIVFLCILSNIRGEQTRVYSTNEKYEWFTARGKCNLLTNEQNFSSFPTRLGWTSFSAKYLPWVEYLGCFKFRNVTRFYGLKNQVTEGEQLQICNVHCSGTDFFGLQESTCICLNNPNSTDLYKYVEKPCDSNVATCSGDPFAFCGTEDGRQFLSVYQKASVPINDRSSSRIGSCLEFDNIHGYHIASNCSKELYPMCYDEYHKIFNAGKGTKSNWTEAFANCKTGNIANYSTAIGKRNEFPKRFSDKFWLSNLRRWKNTIDVTGNPLFCVAARIKQNGVVEKSIRECRDHLPALCVEVLKTSTDAPSKTFSTLSDLPDKDGVSVILIIVIVAATILIVIIILVTSVLCRRKRNTQVPISNESLPMVGKETVYAQVNKPTVERKSNTSNQNSQPAAIDDTYDHMDHRRLSQTHNPTESNYDTMRSIANAGEEENNYDHVTGTKIESKRFVVDGASNYSHVEMEFHEVKDI